MFKPKSALRKPKIDIDLTGPEGNAIVLLGHALLFAEALGKDGPAIVAEMKKSNYEHLLHVFDLEFGDLVTLDR